MKRAQAAATGRRDNLDRLLGLLRAARAEQEARQRVDPRTAYLDLLAAIEAAKPAARAGSPAAA